MLRLMLAKQFLGASDIWRHFGLLLGAGYYTLSMGALLLFLANIFSVNLAGVATFISQGIEPRSWWDAKKARRVTILAIAGWAILLALLITFIFYGDFYIVK